MFKTLLVLAAAVALAAAEVESPKVKEKNGVSRTQVLDVSDFIQAAAASSADPRDTCFTFRKANNGWDFKAARDELPDEEKLCIEPCADGRTDCYSVTEESGCSDSCSNCVKPVVCKDSRDKDRCYALKDCKCTTGDFRCLPSNTGVKIKRAKPGDGALSKNGYFFTFQRVGCEEDGTFNMVPCDPATETCNSIEPCLSRTNSCCMLVSSEEAPVETSTATSTSTSTTFEDPLLGSSTVVP